MVGWRSLEKESAIRDTAEEASPRLGGRERDPHRLGIAHLPHDDDVGRLTHGRAQGGGEVRSVGSDLDLLDEARAVRVLVFDRILDRQNVMRVSPIDLLDQRRECRRLAGSGGSAHQDEAARQARQSLDAGRQPQGRQARRFGGKRAHRCRRPAALAVQVDAKAPEPARLEGPVGAFSP